MEDATLQVSRCPRCGRTLASDVPEGLCPQCLFDAGTETLTGAGRPEEPPTLSSAEAEALHRAPGARLTEGELWGGYRITRLLGAGGMGEVYEAEQMANGRRVALKVLRSRLQRPEDRAQFLREGQLAASISHPHTVYIFGSEEIAGMPVITMELLSGGTLKDRVVASGPLSPGDAVTAVLEIIGGLDAAHAAGILHRDIKPSNCFLDNDGSVKVGDFGLSISTLARDVRFDLATAGFEGTPQYAAPEQLRGEPLDVRADIYAVGGTLYYLLTGRAPFDAPELRDLVQRVLNDAPVSPRRLRPEIPAGLAAIVLRCLSKTPADRPASYSALADLLRPFSQRDYLPARLGPRFIAGAIDNVLVNVPAGFLLVALTGEVGPGATTSAAQEAVRPFGPTTWTWLVQFVYFLIVESLWGRSIGKMIFGLRVTAPTGAARPSQIAIRALLYQAPSIITSFIILALGSLPIIVIGNFHTNQNATQAIISLSLVAMLFVTARGSNGWAALHDLVSHTRVVTRVRSGERAVDAPRAAAAKPTAVQGRLGPFELVAEIGRTEEGMLNLAFDGVLRRPVWIHKKPFNAAEPPAARRDVSRIGRLHWLAGQRMGEGRWDAYEAPEGEPFASCTAATDWKTVKPWLRDIAGELLAASRDGSMLPLALERLWLRRDGHLVLLDFDYPGAKAMVAPGTPSPMTPVQLISTILDRAAPSAGIETPNPGTLPLSARRLARDLHRATPPSLEAIDERLAQLSTVPEFVPRWRRAIPIALSAAPAAFVISALAVLTPSVIRIMNPDTREMIWWINELRAEKPEALTQLSDPSLRETAEIYVVGRWRDTWPTFRWKDGPMTWNHEQDFSAQLLARHPSVSAEQFAQATARLPREIARGQRARGNANQGRDLLMFLLTMLLAIAVGLTLMATLVCAAIVPGGVVTRLIGLAVVRSNGQEIGRARSLARAALAWSPAIVWFIYLAQSPKAQGWIPQAHRPILAASLALTPLALGAIWTILHPTRSLQDRAANTWVVPR